MSLGKVLDQRYLPDVWKRSNQFVFIKIGSILVTDDLLLVTNLDPSLGAVVRLSKFPLGSYINKIINENADVIIVFGLACKSPA